MEVKVRNSNVRVALIWTTDRHAMFNLGVQITLLGNPPLMLIERKRKSNNLFAEWEKNRSALLDNDPLQMNHVTQFIVYEA